VCVCLNLKELFFIGQEIKQGDLCTCTHKHAHCIVCVLAMWHAAGNILGWWVMQQGWPLDLHHGLTN